MFNVNQVIAMKTPNNRIPGTTAVTARFVAVWMVVLTASLWLTGCSEDTVAPPAPDPIPASKYKYDVPVAWFQLQMVLIEKSAGFSPPVASRALGYSGVALYEAIVPGMTDYNSLVGKLNGLTSLPAVEAGKDYHWPTVANSAMATISRHMYANATTEYMAKIDSLENHFVAKYKDSLATDLFNRSVARGKAVSDAIFEWSKTDGGHEGYTKNFPTSYVPPVGPGMWEPTPRPSGPPQNALQPYWGNNRPFILPVGNVNATVDPGAPLAYSTDTASAFYKEGLEVYNTVKNLTAEQRAIALFWSDDPGATCTPPGHSISILNQANIGCNMSLDFCAAAYAKVGIAVADAFISCWAAKYKYNLLRPITYIQKVIDNTWNNPTITDPLTTPPFPEYPSGHSVQSGAAATVLSAMFGPAFAFTDHTHDAKGKAARTFSSFNAAADEAALSRLYGGIHFRAAIERGVQQGNKIGAAVNAIAFKK